MLYRYIVGGIVLEAEFELPELIVTSMEEVDVTIKYGIVPEKLKGGSSNQVLFSFNDQDEVLFTMPDIARYLIVGNSSITVDLIDENRKDDAHKYLLTFVLGVLSFKKEFFPLHGGGIVHNGEAYMFSGNSGAGKSTTMAGLQERGYASVGDDIANLYMHKSGKVFVHPCFPRFKLWEESLNLLNKKDQGEYKLRMDMSKYLVPVDNFHTSSLPVKRIYLLQENLQGESSFTVVSGPEKLLKIKANSYKPWMVKSFGLQQLHFGLMTKLAKEIEFVIFDRPKDKTKISEMLDLIENHIKGE